MIAALALLFIGIAAILWGVWGDFVKKSPAHLVTLRLESGVAFLASSVACYLLSESSKRKRRPLE
jgi:hypothetical protein